jgi:uncharacterized membrane protein YbhN (UPF0104 family)
MLTIVPLLNNINRYILNPIILLLFSVALLVFFWGLFRFISNADNETERETGRQNIMYGLIGMFIMVSVYGLMRLVLGSFGISAPGYIRL